MFSMNIICSHIFQPLREKDIENVYLDEFKTTGLLQIKKRKKKSREIQWTLLVHAQHSNEVSY